MENNLYSGSKSALATSKFGQLDGCRSLLLNGQRSRATTSGMPQTLAPDVKSAPKSGEKLEEVQSRPRLLRTISSNAKSLIGVQHSKSIVLKSHGRPPWLVLCSRFILSQTTMYLFFRYGEDGKHISDAFVIGVAGTL